MPPVSSRTTRGSVPSMRSRRSGEASYSAGSGLTGRRLAYSPRPLRRPNRPCSGLGALGSVVSHLGPPTAASSTASALRQASSTSSVRATPWASIEAPPKTCSSNSKSRSLCSSSSVGAMISGPMPSPGRVTMRCATASSVHRARGNDALARLPGDGGDSVEVAVVVHHHHACRRGGRGHEQIGHLAAALMALGEQPLHLPSTAHVLGSGLGAVGLL